jgi:hypothetical protein
MIVKIIVEVISILSIATAEIKQRRSERIASKLSFLSHISVGRYLNRLLGKNDIEAALKRLDTLTQEEARMAVAEVLKVTHNMDDKICLFIDGAQCSFSQTRYPDYFMFQQSHRNRWMKRRKRAVRHVLISILLAFGSKLFS